MFHNWSIPSFLFAIIICLYLDEAFPNHGAKVRLFGQKKTAVPNCLSTAASLYRMIIGLLQT